MDDVGGAISDKDDIMTLLSEAKNGLSEIFLRFILYVLCLMQLIAAYMIYNGKAEFVANVKQTYSIAQKQDSSLPINMVNEEKQEKTNPTINTVETSSIPVVATEVSAVEKEANIPPKDNVLGSACKEVSECPKKNFQNGKGRGKGKKGQSANQSKPKSTPAGSKGK